MGANISFRAIPGLIALDLTPRRPDDSVGFDPSPHGITAASDAIIRDLSSQNPDGGSAWSWLDCASRCLITNRTAKFDTAWCTGANTRAQSYREYARETVSLNTL